jgi:hypothetical protein
MSRQTGDGGIRDVQLGSRQRHPLAVDDGGHAKHVGVLSPDVAVVKLDGDRLFELRTCRSDLEYRADGAVDLDLHLLDGDRLAIRKRAGRNVNRQRAVRALHFAAALVDQLADLDVTPILANAAGGGGSPTGAARRSACAARRSAGVEGGGTSRSIERGQGVPVAVTVYEHPRTQDHRQRQKDGFLHRCGVSSQTPPPPSTHVLGYT